MELKKCWSLVNQFPTSQYISFQYFTSLGTTEFNCPFCSCNRLETRMELKCTFQWHKLFVFITKIWVFYGKIDNSYYIRDKSEIFSISPLVKISLTSFLCFSFVFRLVFFHFRNTHIYVIKRKLHVGLSIWSLSSQGKKILNIFSTRR